MIELPDELVIEVTQEDIDNGCRMEGSYCPIALAVRRVLKSLGYDGDNLFIIVGCMRVVINYNIFKQGEEDFSLNRFVRGFDQGFPQEPGTLGTFYRSKGELV